MSAEHVVIVTWPESQLIMDHPDFEKECILINDEEGLEKWGPSAYVVPQYIYNECFGEPK